MRGITLRRYRFACIALAVVVSTIFLACNSGSGSRHDALENTPAPDTKLSLVTAKDEAPELVGLDRFHGKAVLLNVWATWCGPCVEEMPALERLYQLKHSEGLEVVAVSVDADRKAVQQFLQKSPLSFTVLHDPGMKLANRLGVSGFPETFLISRDGKFQRFHDPEEGKDVVRVIADRPWDSAPFIESITKALSAKTGA